jgi:hypothetical protein
MRQGWIVALVLAGMCGCIRGWSGKIFSYPSGSRIECGDWTHRGGVIETDPFCNPYGRQRRAVRIWICDRQKHVLLDDRFTVVSGWTEGVVEWKDFTNLVITLLEKGNEYATRNNNAYNEELLRSGPRPIMTVRYTFDGSQFRRECGVKNVLSAELPP